MKKIVVTNNVKGNLAQILGFNEFKSLIELMHDIKDLPYEKLISTFNNVCRGKAFACDYDECLGILTKEKLEEVVIIFDRDNNSNSETTIGELISKYNIYEYTADNLIKEYLNKLYLNFKIKNRIQKNITQSAFVNGSLDDFLRYELVAEKHLFSLKKAKDYKDTAINVIKYDGNIYTTLSNALNSFSLDNSSKEKVSVIKKEFKEDDITNRFVVIKKQ